MQTVNKKAENVLVLAESTIKNNYLIKSGF